MDHQQQQQSPIQQQQQNISTNESSKSGSKERIGILGRPVLKASPSSIHTARESILNAMDIIEAENSHLRTVNSKIMTEVETLQVENERLRKELENISIEKGKALKNMSDMLEHSRKTQKICESKVEIMEKKLVLYGDNERKLSDENNRYKKEIKYLQGDIIEKENDLNIMAKEIESMRIKLDRASRRSETDIELLHELEMLKNQRREWASEKHELGKLQKKLKTDMSNLEIQLGDKENELKNETRRHGLLTKEFNSLLEENNRLKLQLRRKGNSNVINCNDNLAPPQEEAITVIPYSPPPPGGVPTSNLGHSKQFTPSNREKITSSRDYPLSSREKSMVSRSHTFIAPSKEPSLFKQNASFSIRETQGRVQKTGAFKQNMAVGYPGTPSSEVLPSLLPGSGKSGKWRP